MHAARFPRKKKVAFTNFFVPEVCYAVCIPTAQFSEFHTCSIYAGLAQIHGFKYGEMCQPYSLQLHNMWHPHGVSTVWIGYNITV